MANLKKRLNENIEGNFYVDSTCINCDTCRQIAPQVFADTGDYSAVYQQPQNPKDIKEATYALLACPTASIGTVESNQAPQLQHDFPLAITEGISYLGYNARSSFGANSYFIEHPDGNWMVDSPKFVGHLAKTMEARGGVSHIFLTHKDDIADSKKYQNRFLSKRIIHKDDSQSIAAEIILKGQDPIELHKDFTIIPVPGHTKGSCVLLYKNKYLFTGDHLCWSRTEKRLHAFRTANWHSWSEQIQSMKKLAAFEFEWILTGHGQSHRLDVKAMQQEMQKLLKWMSSVA